jgi:hypothetical protein
MVSPRSVEMRPIFGAAAERDDAGTGQPLAEVGGKGASQVGTARFDPLDPPALQHVRQSANGGFDFRQFGHGIPGDNMARSTPLIPC